MSKASDLALRIATLPQRLHGTFLDKITPEQRDAAFALQAIYQAGKATASLREMHAEFFKITGYPRSRMSFHDFLRDDGTRYPKAKANGKAKKRR
jgi:hypothetical protein